MATQKKIDTVKELTDKLSKAKAFVLADYRGLKHKQLEELRKLLKKVQGEFMVAKNRLFKRALVQNTGQTPNKNAKALEPHLTDTTGVLFNFADEIAPLKELLKFFKSTGFGKIKAGFVSGEMLDEAQVIRIAGLPARPMLLAQLAVQLNVPIQSIHRAMSWNLMKLAYALDAVKRLKQIKN